MTIFIVMMFAILNLGLAISQIIGDYNLYPEF